MALSTGETWVLMIFVSAGVVVGCREKEKLSLFGSIDQSISYCRTVDDKRSSGSELQGSCHWCHTYILEGL